MVGSINILMIFYCCAAAIAGIFSGLFVGLSIVSFQNKRAKKKYIKKKEAIVRKRKKTIVKVRKAIVKEEEKKRKKEERALKKKGLYEPQEDDPDTDIDEDAGNGSDTDVGEDMEGSTSMLPDANPPENSNGEKLREPISERIKKVPYISHGSSSKVRFPKRHKKSLLESRTMEYVSDLEYDCELSGASVKEAIQENGRTQDEAYNPGTFMRNRKEN